MRSLTQLCLLGLVAVLAWPLNAGAQFNSETLSFEGTPVPVPQLEMFRNPTLSSSTRGIKPPPVTLPDLTPYALRTPEWEGSEGIQSLGAVFTWGDSIPTDGLTDDPYAWVRLTTFDGAVWPNPSLHTQGKIRFNVKNPNIDGLRSSIGLCVAIRETDTQMPQLWNGGTTGPIEWVGVSTALSVIECGTNSCQSVRAGDDVQVNAGGVEAIHWGADRVLQTTPLGDDVAQSGYIRAPDNGAKIPIPAVTIPTDLYDWTQVEVDLSAGTIAYDGGTPVGQIVNFNLGDGILNPSNNRGTLDALCITNDVADIRLNVGLYIDELQFEAPAHDPIAAPQVQSTIVAGAGSVTVTNLVPSVTKVSLYRNTDAAIDQTVSPGTKDCTFYIDTVTAGETFKATQTDDLPQTSGFSSTVTALAGPPQYNFSLLLDEGGTGGCNYTTGGWEWLGVTSVLSSWTPFGQPLALRNDRWQTVEIPILDPNLTRAGLGGNGQVTPPSPNANGSWTIDSLWFTSALDATTNGPWEVFIDGVELVDGSDNVIGTILSMEDGVNRLVAIRGQSAEYTDASGLSGAASYDGASSHRLLWTYDGTAIPPSPARSLGMIQRTGSQTNCGSNTLIDDAATKLRFHVLARELRDKTKVAIPMPQILGPVAGNQTTVQILNNASATAIDLYIDGELAVTGASPTGTATDVAIPLGYQPLGGKSVAAKQTLPAGQSMMGYARFAGAPLPPTVQSPIVANATSVTVSNLLNVTHAVWSTVTVYYDTGSGPVSWQSATSGTPPILLTNPSTPLPQNAKVTATQTVNGVASAHSTPVTVGLPPGPPTVSHPLQAGNMTVNVTSLNPLATHVHIYDGTTDISGAVPTGGLTTMNVPLTSALVHLGQITAAAENASGIGAKSTPAKEVGKGNGNVYICLGIRETATTVAIGADGTIGIAGTPTIDIEWLGATTATPPQSNHPISPLGTWQTITFNPATEPIRAFAGAANGILASATNKGTIEHIAITVNSASAGRSIGAYVMYVDNIVNVGAGSGGTDALVSDFESSTVGAQTMFRQPSFSSSTSAHILTSPNSSVCTNEQGNPGKCVKASWYFVDTGARWLRLTTYSTPAAPLPLGNPTVDLTKPIKLDILLLAILPPAAPTLVAPLVAGSSTVTVNGVDSTANLVQIFSNGSPIGSVNPAGQTTGVVVPVDPLVAKNSITAKQTVPGKGTSGPSDALEVGSGSGDVLICIGIRETGDTGALGSPGSGTVGGIEWVGVTTKTTGGAPLGNETLTPGVWKTLEFNPADPVADPVMNFYLGDGVINAPNNRGVLEHLAVTVNSTSDGRSTGPYNLYVDNVVNVGAGAEGTDLVITNFQAAAVGTQVFLQEPRYSGTTDDEHLALLPNNSAVSGYQGNPGKSEWLSWFWKDTTADRWVRLTTAAPLDGAAAPIIDLTKKIRLDVLLTDAVPGDMDADGDVDLLDYAAWAACLAGPNVSTPPGGCTAPQFALADLDGDLDVDDGDFADFQVRFPFP